MSVHRQVDRDLAGNEQISPHSSAHGSRASADGSGHCAVACHLRKSSIKCQNRTHASQRDGAHSFVHAFLKGRRLSSHRQLPPTDTSSGQASDAAPTEPRKGARPQGPRRVLLLFGRLPKKKKKKTRRTRVVVVRCRSFVRKRRRCCWSCCSCGVS